MLHIKLAQSAVRCALPPRRSESPVCANDNKPSCVLHLLGGFIGSRGFSSLERRPEFWVLQTNTQKDVLFIIRDRNAKVGSQEIQGVRGKCGFGIQNKAGPTVIEFCQENALATANTLFQPHKRRLYTWTSPDGQH